MTLAEACAYVDAAPNPRERARRKDETFWIRCATPMSAARLREVYDPAPDPKHAKKMLDRYLARFPEVLEYLARSK